MIAWIAFSNVVLHFSVKENVQLFFQKSFNDFPVAKQKNWAVLVFEQNIGGLSQFACLILSGRIIVCHVSMGRPWDWALTVFVLAMLYVQVM